MTSTEHRRTWSERLDPRNWSLVAKLAIVGLVPTVLALALGAARVIEQANVAEELGQGSGLIEVHQQIGALTRSLQAERAAAVTFVGGNRLGDRGAVDGAQAATDQAVQRTTQQLDNAERQAPQLATARRQAETTLGQLEIIRSQVAGGSTPALDLTTRYTSVVQRTLGLDRALLGQLQTAETAGLSNSLGSAGNALEALELERTVLNGAIAARQLQEPDKALVNGAEAAYQSASGDFQAALTPAQVGQFGNFAQDPANNDRQALRDAMMATPAGSPITADPAAWNAAVDRSTQVTRSSAQQAEDSFVGGRAKAAENAGNTAGLNSVLLMLGLLLTIGIILLLGRQLVRSLRVLRTSALDVAERRLPQAVQGMRSGQTPSALVEPVPLDSRDEIGEVARAFDAVHGQAIRLAADQAALQQNVNSMFVNLSRRSQALVERQLQLIEQLESNEQDPDQLSNLFQLDHLATRMRRNSENLLVLAGTDLAKRNVAPVQVVDVLRAAVSEVEQYQRVVVQTPPTATVAGRAANDMVHLLAELLDNATNFSPPDSQVVMSTTRTADESLLIEIADRGVGMADAELADANQRLSGPSEVDVSASRRMGLFVVGRLAARHRVAVRLSSASSTGRSGGLSASVTIPVQLVPSAANLPRRDERAPAAVERGGSNTGAWPMPQTEERPRPALNGTGRSGSLPSMVAGSDGPMTPTFESGSGQARNGTSSKLPTRTPGSALRRNGGADSPTGEESPTGQETSANGSRPGGTNGAQAFAPLTGQRDGSTGSSGPDMFTPAGSRTDDRSGPTPSTNGSAFDAGSTGGRGPTDDRGPAGTGSAGGPGGPDRRQPDDRADAEHTDADEAPTGEDRSDDSTADAEQASGNRGLLGTIAAAAAGGAAAAGFAGRDRRSDEPQDADERETADAASESGTGPADHTAAASDESAGSGTTDAPTAPDADERPDAEFADAESPDAEPQDAETTNAESSSTESSDTGHSGTEQPESGQPESEQLDTGRLSTTRPDTEQQASTAEGSDGSASAGAGAAGLAAAGAGIGGVAAAGAGTDRAGADDAGSDETAPDEPATADAAGSDPTGSGATGSDGRGTDTADRDAPGADTPAHGIPSTGGGAAQGPPPVDPNSDTTSIPAVPPGPGPAPARQPMGGGGLPQRGPNGLPFRPRPAPSVPPRTGPAPSGRPVMPGGPQRRPDPAPVSSQPRGAAAGGRPEALFAPAVPVEGDRGQLRRPGGLEAAKAGGGYDIGQTTPIFEEIASAWFRSNRSVPVRWQDGESGSADGSAPGAPAQQPGTAPRPTPGPAVDPADTPEPDSAFASPADAVWRQATTETPESSEEQLTSAGLPKRRPRARLLPGSAAGSTVLSPSAGSEVRTAENVRGRLASYQQGVRQGRENAAGRPSRTGNGSTEPADDRSNTSEHEETT